MFELFVIGTFWFWMLVAAEIIMLFVFIDNENGIGATISVLVFGALLQWFGNVDIITYIRMNPTFIVSCLAAYFACGAVWGVVKWWIFCRDKLEEYEETRAEFFRSKNIPTSTKVVPPELRQEWKEYLSRNTPYGQRDKVGQPPQVRDHKAKIMRWMTFWVVSIIWSFINDFVKRVFRTIYLRLSTFLQRISDNMFGNIKDDFEVPTNDRD
jgi:hypothetical protein